MGAASLVAREGPNASSSPPTTGGLLCRKGEDMLLSDSTRQRLLWLCDAAHSLIEFHMGRNDPDGQGRSTGVGTGNHKWDDTKEYPPQFALARANGFHTVDGDTRPLFVCDFKKQRSGDGVRDLWCAMSVLAARDLFPPEAIPSRKPGHRELFSQQIMTPEAPVSSVLPYSTRWVSSNQQPGRRLIEPELPRKSNPPCGKR
jgi:hypothetical protein